MGKRTQIAAMCTILLFGGGVIYPETARAQSGADTQTYAIPAGDLNSALRQFSQQSRVQLIYPTELVDDKRSGGLSGSFTAAEALRRLLDGSGLGSEQVNDKTVVLKKVPVAPRSGAQATERSAPAKSQPEEAVVRDLEKLTVTGTRISGAELTSPILTITREDMRLSGHSNLGEVLRALPQNFSGGQNPGVFSSSAGNRTNENVTNGSSFNLRGLGADATLTLLNGTRLAYQGAYQAVDVGAIPAAAVDRVDVLLDGASAIYGSDAVGGVVNVILRRDYSGAEVSARVGTATSGGYTQTQYTAAAGTTWDSGGLIGTVDVSRNTSASSGQRNYLADMSPDTDFYPNINQKSLVISGHQKLAENLELVVDGFYSDRDGRSNYQSADARQLSRQGSSSWGIHPSLSFSFGNEMQLKLHAGLGESTVGNLIDGFSVSSGQQTFSSGEYYDNKNVVAGLEFSGILAKSWAGPIGYSVGGGYRETEFAWRYDSTVQVGRIDDKHNRNSYVYGEIDVPLVSDDQSIPLVRQLSINGAVRYEDHSNFGEAKTPKIGVFWGVNDSFDVKASWGRSFKAPSLEQQYQPQWLYYYPSAAYVGAPQDGTVLLTWGGNPDLRPEEATVITAGFVFRPDFLEGMRLELNWFDIDFSKRIVNPHRSFNLALVDPASEDFRIINPSIDQINHEFEKIGRIPGDLGEQNFGNPDYSPRPYNADEVYAIVESRLMNAARNKVRGIDLSASYPFDLWSGVLTLTGSGSWITDSLRMNTQRAEEISYAGWVYTPSKFKGRLNASWSRDALSVSTTVNHIAGVINDLVSPHVKGDPMTTIDLVVDYQMDSGNLGGVGVALGVMNLLNQRPPYMQHWLGVGMLPFDATNYSALGRVVNLTLSKRF